MINSQGKQTSESYLEQVAREKAYLDEIRAILDRRDANGGEFTVEMAQDYGAVLEKYGVIKAKPSVRAASVMPVPK